MFTAKQIEKLKVELAQITIPKLVWNKENKDFDEVLVPPTIFYRNNFIIVSAEDGNDFADYYGEYRGGYSWIHPKLEAWAKEKGYMWEWENPGCIQLIDFSF